MQVVEDGLRLVIRRFQPHLFRPELLDGLDFHVLVIDSGVPQAAVSGIEHIFLAPVALIDQAAAVIEDDTPALLVLATADHGTPLGLVLNRHVQRIVLRCSAIIQSTRVAAHQVDEIGPRSLMVRRYVF